MPRTHKGNKRATEESYLFELGQLTIRVSGLEAKTEELEQVVKSIKGDIHAIRLILTGAALIASLDYAGLISQDMWETIWKIIF